MLPKVSRVLVFAAPTFHVASRSFHDKICCRKFVETKGGFPRKSEGVSLNLKSSSQIKIVETLKTTLGRGKKRTKNMSSTFMGAILCSVIQTCFLLIINKL